MAVLSKPLPVVVLNRDRKNVTRYQERRIRMTFDLLGLPAEMREMIYDLLINFHGIESYFDRAWRKVRLHAENPKKTSENPLVVNPKTPNILLICRQVYQEASSFIAKRTVNFHHGLLRLPSLEYVVSENILRNLQSINITTKGHSILAEKTDHVSWSGYMGLFTDLARILSQGHKLKTLCIDLDDPALTEHMSTCFHSIIHCDFRDHIKEVCEHLRSIRGVGCVTLKGLPAHLSVPLKMRMESKPVSFLSLPGELRNRIYEYSASYSDSTNQITRVLDDWPTTEGATITYPAMTTPTILLLNKQINIEAQVILSKQTLNIICPSSPIPKRQADVLDILQLISATTMQNLEHMNIRIESWEWIYAIEKVLMVLESQHNLRSFRLHLHDRLKKKFVRNETKIYPDACLATCLDSLARIAGIDVVEITGDLPDVYTRPLRAMMQAPANMGALMPPPMAVSSDGSIVNVVLEA